MREYWEKFKVWIVSVKSTWFFLGYSIADFLRVPTIMGFLFMMFWIAMVVFDKQDQA